MRTALTFFCLAFFSSDALANPMIDWSSGPVVLSVGHQGCNGGWPVIPGWTAWMHSWTVSGDAAQGDTPDDVAAACNRQWLQSTVGSATWDGTEWTLDVAVRAYDTCEIKEGTCALFLNLQNESSVDVSFE